MTPKQTNNKKQSLPFVSPFLSPGFQGPQEDMNWSMDPLQAPASSSLHVTLASEHIPSPHVLSHNKGSNGKNRVDSTVSLVLSYSKG